MDKKLVTTLIVEGVVGIAITVWLYLWGQGLPPCEEMGCLVNYRPAFYLVAAIATGFILLLTLAISSIGNALRKK